MNKSNDKYYQRRCILILCAHVLELLNTGRGGKRYSYQNMSGGQALYHYHSSQLAVKKEGNNRTLVVEPSSKPCVPAN